MIQLHDLVTLIPILALSSYDHPWKNSSLVVKFLSGA
jgi:hypothetical protein